MLKKVIGFAVVLAALSLSAVSASARAEKFIGEMRAKEIALQHAQVRPESAEFVKIKLDRGRFKTEYELEFWADGVEYEYDIDAESGSILKFSREAKRGGRGIGGGAGSGLIGEKRAVEIALARVPGATERHVRKLKLDYEHGVQVYEGEIVYNWREYEFEIDAKSGELVKWEIDD